MDILKFVKDQEGALVELNVSPKNLLSAIIEFVEVLHSLKMDDKATEILFNNGIVLETEVE